MSNISSSVDLTAVKPMPKETGWRASNWGLVAAVSVMIIIMLFPAPEGLPLAGHRMLAIFGFAVIVWVTEALDYAISAVVIAALWHSFSGYRRMLPIQKC